MASQSQLNESVPSPPQSIAQGRELVGPDSITVVVPTLNEREGIGIVLDELLKEGFKNVIVVDGYSTDGTAEIAGSKGAIVMQQLGTGKAGAIRTAVEAISTPYVLIMDGDTTYRAEDIYRLLKYASSYDEVIGARTTGRKNIPWINRFGNRMISMLFKLLFDQPITDVLSGMYLVKTDKLREMQITSSSFDVEVEIACTIAASGSITQVPIDYRERVGKQKLSPGSAGRILSTLFWMANYYNPVLIYGIIGSLAAIPAIVILGWTAYEALFPKHWHSGYAIFGAMLLLLASQAAAVSMVSVLIKRSESRLMRRLRLK